MSNDYKIRQRTQMWEDKYLSKFAARSQNSKGRVYHVEPCPIRTCYQRDRDRVIHCKAFRRLKHKTQVFLSPEGDHYRTRLTHTLEVSQIARTIARALRLNEDLTEAIALAHDLGHTPFGHAGERALNEISGCGFKHNEQSVRVVEKIENEGSGLNLTFEVRDGILCHTDGHVAETMEGRLIRYADRFAYINHDIDDAIRAGVFKESDIPNDITLVLGDSTSQRINTLVTSLIENTHEDEITLGEEVKQKFDRLREFMFETVYRSPYAKSEEKKIPYFIERLYNYFYKRPEKLDDYLINIAKEEGKDRAVCDYIAGMTDHYAIEVYENLFVPKNWRVL